MMYPFREINLIHFSAHARKQFKQHTKHLINLFDFCRSFILLWIYAARYRMNCTIAINSDPVATVPRWYRKVLYVLIHIEREPHPSTEVGEPPLQNHDAIAPEVIYNKR